MFLNLNILCLPIKKPHWINGENVNNAHDVLYVVLLSGIIKWIQLVCDKTVDSNKTVTLNWYYENIYIYIYINC